MKEIKSYFGSDFFKNPLYPFYRDHELEPPYI